MKTVVWNNDGVKRPYPLPENIGSKPIREFKQGRSCFYDFGAQSSLEFSEYVKEDSDFIRKVGRMFNF